MLRPVSVGVRVGGSTVQVGKVGSKVPEGGLVVSFFHLSLGGKLYLALPVAATGHVSAIREAADVGL